MLNWGAFCFGLVIGWVTYRTLRRAENASVSDIAAVVGAVGGAAILELFGKGELFGYYGFGLAAGFFLYFVIGLIISRGDANGWMMAGGGRGAWMAGGKPGS